MAAPPSGRSSHSPAGFYLIPQPGFIRTPRRKHAPSSQLYPVSGSYSAQNRLCTHGAPMISDGRGAHLTSSAVAGRRCTRRDATRLARLNLDFACLASEAALGNLVSIYPDNMGAADPSKYIHPGQYCQSSTQPRRGAICGCSTGKIAQLSIDWVGYVPLRLLPCTSSRRADDGGTPL